MYRDIDIDDFLESINNNGYFYCQIYTANVDLVSPNEIHKYFEYEKIEQLIDLKMDLGDFILVYNV